MILLCSHVYKHTSAHALTAPCWQCSRHGVISCQLMSPVCHHHDCQHHQRHFILCVRLCLFSYIILQRAIVVFCFCTSCCFCCCFSCCIVSYQFCITISLIIWLLIQILLPFRFFILVAVVHFAAICRCVVWQHKMSV